MGGQFEESVAAAMAVKMNSMGRQLNLRRRVRQFITDEAIYDGEVHSRGDGFPHFDYNGKFIGEGWSKTTSKGKVMSELFALEAAYAGEVSTAEMVTLMSHGRVLPEQCSKATIGRTWP